MKILLIALFVSLTSCNQNQQNLDDGLYAEFVTNKGNMTAKLFYKKVPVTVANFVALAEGTHPKAKEEFKGKPYYDGIIFHRVIDSFMIQGGDPTGTGAGGPGYKFQDEFNVDLTHDKAGILSMANAGPRSNGSQFFITDKATPFLNFRHSVFGELVSGLDVEDAISNVKTGAKDKPEQDVVIEKVNIIRVGADAKAFDAAKVFTEEEPKMDAKLAEFKNALKQKKIEEGIAASKTAAENFLVNNDATGKTVKKLPTGLVMLVKEAKNAVKPTQQQNVLINYAGYFEDGKLFDTNLKEIAKQQEMYNEEHDKKGKYQPFSMIYNKTAKLAPGFREAMLNMNVGDEARVFIPSYLGYGERGYGPIPPNTNLIFDLKIEGIDKK